jgi:NAD(P)-dependent dehydrogenase (short-subunit alcohol dehydrogenase family)
MKKLALITGASRGLGATLTAFLAGLNQELIITARNAGHLRTTAAATGSSHITAVPGDVNDAQHRRRLHDLVAQHGRLDLLVNNASNLGVSPLPPLAEYPLADFETVLRTNVIAPIALVQTLLPFLASARGLVVNVSSDAARGGYPGWGAYGASKAALDLASLTLSNELRAQGIAVVSVDPGDMRTDMHQAAYPGQDITDRPRPDVTIPFWAWLLAQDPLTVSGRRFEAQADRWEAGA